ncbi:hypothetical protein SEA_NIOBE_27 [Arthrobacter phage Niobe]|uniref:Uncharacterized protein n=1 Tax=Arthrobacter phage Elezi TaxID=2762410 RepID=A0A7G8LH05_9CAUD|nr:hypothetical protein PQE13_gp27 [Arthrobacter phage Elezi]QNJ56527.1 hypothetical protein SEA_ELEZI_27 [Arthrobacter phage Elezi]QOP64330.1 hypothetical protein SEA_LONDON_27 [Arthrobacter phage London]UAJ15388.1 hypothetical protein SEA_ASA16_27 [Arthrobacter phage Asa16]
MNNKTATLPEIQKAATDAIYRSLGAPDTERTALLREAARKFVEAREHFYTKDGDPDWLGRTHAYRLWVREVMSEAHVPGEDVTSLQAAIRYHSGNVLRERLDDDALESLGLKRTSPRERSVEKRERTSGTLNLFGGGAEISDPEDIIRACTLIEAALKRVNAATVANLPAKERRETRAALRSVAERALALAK